jgi:leukotriene-A4 hydrolase
MPDPTTQSNYLQICTTNVDFNWTLDFARQVVEGSATHTLLSREAGIEEVMYTKHYWVFPRIDNPFLKF